MMSNEQQARSNVDLNSALSDAVSKKNTINYSQTINFNELSKLPYLQKNAHLFSTPIGHKVVFAVISLLLLMLFISFYQFNNNRNTVLSGLPELKKSSVVEQTTELAKPSVRSDDTPLTPLWKLDVPRVRQGNDHPLFLSSTFEAEEFVSLRGIFDEMNSLYPNSIKYSLAISTQPDLNNKNWPTKTREQYQREWAAKQRRSKQTKATIKSKQYYLARWEMQQAQKKKRAQWEFKKAQLKRQKAHQKVIKNRQTANQLERNLFEEID